MRSYLSIDLDYWRNEPNDKKSAEFFKKAFSLGIPLYVVKTHEQLLDHVNKSKYDLIYNVDFHSDLFGFHDKKERADWIRKNPKAPDEGQWGVFIKWRKNGCFYWLYPSVTCYSVNGHDTKRSSTGACWETKKDNPYLPTTYTDWKEVKRNIGTSPLEWNTVTAIGVSVSPDWTREESVGRVIDSKRMFSLCGLFSGSILIKRIVFLPPDGLFGSNS